MNTLQVIQSVGFGLGFFIYCYFTGAALLELLRVRSSRSMATLTGLITLFAVTELISLPFMLNKGEYVVLFNIMITTAIFSFVISLHFLFVIRKRFDLLKFDFSDFGAFLPILLLVLICVQTAVPVFTSRFDGDDAFYIAVSTSIQTTGRIFLNNPSIGLDAFIFPPNYQFTAYEILITIFSTISHIEPVVLYHSVLPALYMPLYYLANLALAQVLFPGKRKKDILAQYGFVTLIALLTIFDAYSNYLSSSFIQLKAWMGKTCLINFCFVLFLCFFILAYRTEKKEYTKILSPNASYFLLIALCLVAGAGTSAVGLYLIPVSFFTLTIAALITLSYKREDHEWFKIRLNFGIKAFLAAIPSACLLLGFFFFIINSPGLEQLNNFDSNRTWLQDAALMFEGSIPTFCLYIVSCFYFLFFGEKAEKTVFFYGPIILLLTFVNPLFHEVVGRYLTSMPLYWRFFWLFPTFITISAFIISILKEYSPEKWRWIVLIPLLFIFVPSNFALTDSKYYASENSAKIPNDISTTASTIMSFVNTNDPNDLYLLALPHYNIYMRQYTGTIALVMPRMNFVEEAYQLAGKEEDFKILKRLFTLDSEGTINGLIETFNLGHLKQLGINLIIAPEEHPELETQFKRVELKNGDTLYIRNEIFRSLI